MELKIREYIKKIPSEILYIFKVFFLTRAALIVVGIGALSAGINRARELYSSYTILNMWGLWDTRWYLNIARTGYSAQIDRFGQANYGFFPSYPILIKFFSFIFQDYFISALLVSNVCLILSAVFLYKLIRLDCDEQTSRRAIKYLFLFPAAFILSAALSESLFLFLMLGCVYYAKKQKWLKTGIFGMLLTLTKPFGIVVLIPVAYEYIKNRKNNGTGLLKKAGGVFSILLIPAGLAIFSLYTYFLTGDIFAYPDIKESGTGWRNHLANPIQILSSSLHSPLIGYSCGAVASIAVIFLLVLFYKKIGFAYFITGISIVIFCISYNGTMPGALRYYTSLFPIYIIFAKISGNRETDDGLMIFLAILQGFLMAFWTIQSGIII